MRILGIDPGSRITGYGIIEQSGSKQFYITSGFIKIDMYPWPQRLKYIFENIVELIMQYKPEFMAIEEVFVHKNVSSALKLSQARGAAIVAGTHLGLEIAEYSPREIKKAVVGYGAADKNQVQYIIQTVLKLNVSPGSDASDALAVALCHGYKTGKVWA